MEVIKKIVVTLYVLFFLSAGLALLGTSRHIFIHPQEIIKPWPSQFTSERIFWAGWFLVIFGLLLLIVKVIELKRLRSVAFDNPDGEVVITLRTIEDFVLRVGRSFPEVIRVKPVIIPRKRKGLEIVLGLVLQEGVNIPQLTEDIQHQVKTQLHELLGLENVAAIQINVTQIKAGKGRDKGGRGERLPEKGRRREEAQ